MSFIQLNNDNIQISSDSVVSTLWSNNQTILNNIYILSSSYSPYIDIYDKDPNIFIDTESQFSISYGNIYGSGSALINPLVENKTISKTIYGQMRNLINGDENTLINFGVGNQEAEDIFILNINRSRYKEKLFLPTFNIRLSTSSGSINLTNNSRDTNNVEYCDSGRIFDIVSGSNGSSIMNGGYTVSGSYGKYLPDVGIILLNPKALALPFISGGIDLNLDYNNNNINYTSNLLKLFNSINNGSYFSLNSEETITSNFIFINVPPNECNYTTNPSIINDNGELYYDNLINNPEVFVTTIGLYNDSNELLAVAKLSKPLSKNFTKQLSLRVKLDF
jgi:hypothetical protein